MPLVLFRDGQFLRYLTASSANVLATGFLQTSLSLYMLEATGSAGKFGLSLLIGQIPNFVLGLFAGAAVDRLNRRQVMISLAWVRAILLLGFFLFALFQPVREGLVYTLVGLLGICATLTAPAEVAILPSIVSKANLVDANTLQGAISDGLQVAGPVLAALLYSATGVQGSLLLSSILFALDGGLMAFVQVDSPPGEHQRPSLLTDIHDAVGLFYRDMRLTSLVCNGFLTHLFLMPLIFLGFPFMIKQIFHGTNLDVSMVESAVTVGSMSSVLLVTALRKRVTIPTGILLGIMGMILAVLPISLLGSQTMASLLTGRSLHIVLFFGTITILMFVAFGFYGVFYRSFYQSVVPTAMLGRYFAIQAFAFGIARMIGYPLYSWLLDHQPLIMSVLVLGVGMIAKLVVHIPFIRLDRRMRDCGSVLGQ